MAQYAASSKRGLRHACVWVGRVCADVARLGTTEIRVRVISFFAFRKLDGVKFLGHPFDGGISVSMLLSVFLCTAATAPSKDYMCPGSSSFVHAYVKVDALAYANCKAVRSEILSRIASQGQGWHDPHNKGNYSVLDSSQFDILKLQRTTGWPGVFTDKLTFVLEPSGGYCALRGCSESQVPSPEPALARPRLLAFGRDSPHPVRLPLPVVGL
jgi:hypothetical protein